MAKKKKKQPIIEVEDKTQEEVGEEEDRDLTDEEIVDIRIWTAEQQIECIYHMLKNLETVIGDFKGYINDMSKDMLGKDYDKTIEEEKEEKKNKKEKEIKDLEDKIEEAISDKENNVLTKEKKEDIVEPELTKNMNTREGYNKSTQKEQKIYKKLLN